MKLETYIDSLVSYAMNCGLAEPEDHQLLTNRLLEIMGQVYRTQLCPHPHKAYRFLNPG